MTTDAAARLLGRMLARGGDYADLFYEHTVHHRHVLRQRGRAGVLAAPGEDARREVVEGVGLRVLAGTAEGFAATADLSVAALDEAALAAAVASPGRVSPPVFASPVVFDAPADVPDAIAASEKTALLRAAADAALALDADVREVEVTYQDRTRRTLVATSEGRLVVQATPLVGLRVDVTLAAGGRTVCAHAIDGRAGGFGHFFAHPPEVLAREAVARARARLEARRPAAGSMPVVVAGGWGGVWLHEAVGHLLEADVAGGLPPGSRIAPPTVTLVDDATWPGGRGSAACDDEGTPAARTTLVEGGVVIGLLTDRRRAAGLAMPRTGNGRRQDYRHAPLPRMTNLYLAPGASRPDDLVADVRDGLYVSGVGQGVVVPGEDRFAFDVLDGFRIERGRRTRPVTGLRVTGRLSDVLGRLAGVADDFRMDTAHGHCRKDGQVVPVSVGTPTVLFTTLEVEERV